MSDGSELSWLQKQTIIPLQSRDPTAPTVRSLTTLSPDAIKENYSKLVVNLSAKRLGMSLQNALDIAAGTATRTPKPKRKNKHDSP
jgi:hypothetical protein